VRSVRTSRRACARLACLAAAIATAALAACDDGAPEPFFEDVTVEVGIRDRAVREDYPMPESMGTGCALFDHDGDGDLDLYVVDGFIDMNGNRRSEEGANKLFLQDRDGSFAELDVLHARQGTRRGRVPFSAGDAGYGMGVAIGDYDNDGDVDLFVTNWGPDALYRNEGDGTFTDVTAHAGIADDDWSCSAGFFDYDEDGFLDLFVTTYLDYPEGARSADAAGRPEYASPEAFPGAADVLYRSGGDGTFTDVSSSAGIAAPGRGLGLTTIDLDGDGRLDVYVANDGERNAAWINQGDGTFVDRAAAMGLAVNAFGLPEASMGIAVGDVDDNGLLDILVTNLVGETNTLYLQVAPGAYEDRTLDAGLAAPSLSYTGFGADFGDLDLDGDLDLVVVNGRVIRRSPLPGALGGPHWAPYAEPNQLLLNDGTGRFTEAPERAGPLAALIETSRGLALDDLDRDGDLDAVVINGSGTVRVHRNVAERTSWDAEGGVLPPGQWLLVRAVDPALRRDAIGAIVEVRAGRRSWRRVIGVARSYLCAYGLRAHFGLGPIAAYDAVDVTWPGGARERFPGGAADRAIELRRGEGTSTAPSP
jgi:hypothetical protein